MMIDERPTLLLTGASGVMGRALVEQLCGDFSVVCLTRRSGLDDPRVREVQGDIVRPDLDLGPEVLRTLASEVDVVVHSAALTRFGAGRATTFAANLDGTRHVLAVAERAGAPLFHISTAFAGRRDAAGAGSAANAYLDSKAAAEEAVRGSGLPATVIRPSIVCGDSQTGEIAAFQGLLQLAGAVVQGTLPVIPAGPDAHIDFVPSDVAARAVARLVGRGAVGGEYWLTAGASALPLTEVLDLTLAFAERIGREVPRPRLMPPDSLERLLLPLLGDVLPPPLRRRFRAMADLVPLLHAGEPFPSSLADIDAGLAPTRARLTDAFTRSLEYWAAHTALTDAVVTR
jgi:nucleoside-diphosphate-sugar epimerase